MLKSMKMKLAMGILAVAVVGGGLIVAGLNWSDKKAETSMEESVEEKEEESPNKGENSEQGVAGGTVTDSQDEDTVIASDDAEFEVTKVGAKVVDNELITIEYAGSEWDEWNNYRVYFNATNKCDEELSLEVNRYFSVNGFQEYPGDYEIIEAGATIEYMISIDSYFIEKDKIETIDFLDFVFSMRPQITGGITEERVLITPEDSKNGPVLQGYQLCETDEVLIDTEDYLFVVKDYEILYGNLRINYYFQNNTDVDICFTPLDAKINGEARALVSSDLFVFAGGYGSNDTFVWFFDDYTNVELDTIEFDIAVYAEEFEYDPVINGRKELYRQTVTISEIFK